MEISAEQWLQSTWHIPPLTPHQARLTPQQLLQATDVALKNHDRSIQQMQSIKFEMAEQDRQFAAQMGRRKATLAHLKQEAKELEIMAQTEETNPILKMFLAGITATVEALTRISQTVEPPKTNEVNPKEEPKEDRRYTIQLGDHIIELKKTVTEAMAIAFDQHIKRSKN